MRQSTAKDLAQALFEEAGDALFLFDPETDQVHDVNPMAERLSGFSREELLTYQATYLFRFAGQGGKSKLQHAATKTTIFHAQDGFLLRTHQDGVWVPVNVTITRLHLLPRTLALITARDMREQHEAHQRVQRFEAELRRVLAAVSDCLWSADWTTDGKWTYRYLSPVIETLSGRPQNHFLPDLSRWQDVVHPNDRPAWLAALRKLRGGLPSQTEYRVVLPDGTMRWLRESVRVTRKPDGQTLQLDGVMTDFTQRKLSEERLQEERHLLKTLMDNLPEAIYFKDAKGCYLVDNAAHRAMLGAASEEDVLGKSVFDFFPEEIAKRYAEDDQRIIERGEPALNLLETITDYKGTVQLHEYTKVPLRDASGQVTGLICIGRDVTAQREAERALARERNLLRTLMDHLPDHIYVKDTESRFVVANTSTLKSLGAANDEEVHGKTDFDFLPRERAEQFYSDERRVIQTGEPLLNHEELLIDSAGNARWLQTTKLPLRGADGDVIGLVGISHDISTRRTMESELRRAVEVAQQASKAKSEFLARMSHEIRTPMNAVIGMTEQALDTDLNEDQRECLSLVMTSAESLLTVINSILDFSKIEAGKVQLEAAPFHVRDSLADAVRSIGITAQQKRLELACHVAPDVPDLLVGDLGRLRQVIVNLLGNAIKFTDAGEIVLRVALAGPVRDNSVSLCFEVRDTGIGIPREKQQAIFEPFEQVDGSMKRKYEGTGLGLAISSQLVQLMGGTLAVESEVGRGSRFEFTVVFSTIAGQEGSHGPTEPQDVHGLRVLVVDDNATQREILGEMLTNWRMLPVVVESTTKALEELRHAADSGTPYGVLLADAGMPPPDGFSLAAEATSLPGLVGSVVLMLTPADRGTSSDRCREAGASASVLKPIKQSELLDTLLAVATSTSKKRKELIHRPEQDEVHSLPPLRVLLAEDAVVNQRLAVRILEKAGHSVHVANNGAQAVTALAEHQFDLVLMDVQMPEMGGFEATQKIRDRERNERKHTPIIALTAHAMKGDRERCLQAGMDGYVAKPIRAQELFQVIEQVLRTISPEMFDSGIESNLPIPGGEPEKPAMAEVFDRAAALERCGEDEELLRELIDMFQTEVVTWMRDLSSALKNGNAEQVKRLAHTIKGAVGTFAAPAAYDVALRMETIGKEARLSESGPVWVEMQAVMETLKSALTASR